MIAVAGRPWSVVVQSTPAFEDTGEARQRVGVRLSAEARDTRLAGNRFTGLEQDVVEPGPP